MFSVKTIWPRAPNLVYSPVILTHEHLYWPWHIEVAFCEYFPNLGEADSKCVPFLVQHSFQTLENVTQSVNKD